MNTAARRLPLHLGRLPTARPARPLSAASRCWSAAQYGATLRQTACSRQWLSTSIARRKDDGDVYEKKAKALNQKGLDEEEQEVRVKQNQVKRPWLREDADKPPAEVGKEVPSSKGKLLTTPTRLLKLIVPLPVRVEKDKENNTYDYGRALSRNDAIQPLALLVHPQQPLSYVERLIQAELPPVVEDGKEKIPNIYFRAEDPSNTIKHSSETQKEAASNSHVASYSPLGHEASESHSTAEKEKNWVRWSSSTEMGDFIRDAARGREFAIEVEGYNLEMRVSVPSFRDRTYYLRIRLRRMSREIETLAQLKKECDILAHRGAHRLAKGGLALLSGWWAIVYYITFMTDFGWDLIEPYTYLVGLSTIMGGYMWFLFISRDLSYKAAMNITVSKRQSALYEAKGFKIARWEHLVAEANALRKEVKIIAGEYDVDWDEVKDLGGEKVKKVLEKEKAKAKSAGKEDDDDDEDDEDEDEEDEAESKREEQKIKDGMTRGG